MWSQLVVCLTTARAEVFRVGKRQNWAGGEAEQGGSDNGLHHQILSSKSGYMTQHGGPEIRARKIAGADLRRPVVGPAPLPGRKERMKQCYVF